MTPEHKLLNSYARLTYVVRSIMWLYMKWSDMVHGCMVFTERAETTAISDGTSHVPPEQRCKYNSYVDI